MNQEPKTIKVIVVGDGNVGKTCILLTYTQDKFPSEYIPTVFDNYTAQIQVDDAQVTMSLWDTAGQETYSRLRPLSYVSADVFIIVFSVIDPASLQNVFDKWIPELIDEGYGHIPRLIVGNKADQIKPGESILLDNKLDSYEHVECSALTQVNIKHVFETAIRLALKEKLKQQDSEQVNKAKVKHRWFCNLI